MADIATALSSLARRGGTDYRLAIAVAILVLGAFIALLVPLQPLWAAVETAGRFLYLMAIIIG